jgi:SAM-dependent methyltransferase
MPMTKPPDFPPTPIDPEAFKRFEHAGWVEVGGDYGDVFGGLTTQAIEPLLDAAGVGTDHRVLDVASGPGYVATAAARRGAHPLGIDFSSSMIAVARRLHPDLEFREGDAEALPIDDTSVDAVVSGFGLLHFARPERAIAEAFRVLVHGGRVAFSVWDLPERAIGLGVVRAAIESHGRLDVGLPSGPDFFRFAHPQESRAVFEAAGFVPRPITTVPLTWRVSSAEAVIDGFLAAGVRTRGILRKQSPAELEAIRRQVRSALAPYERDGRLELPMPCVVLSAHKP